MLRACFTQKRESPHHQLHGALLYIGIAGYLWQNVTNEGLLVPPNHTGSGVLGAARDSEVLKSVLVAESPYPEQVTADVRASC